MKQKINLFEPEKTPERVHIGLRTVKTVIAVFICSIVGYLRGQPTYFSMMAAVVCIKNTTGKTVEISFNQLMGTVIGASFGIGVLYLEQVTQMRQIMMLYYLVCSLLLIPIILLTLLIKKPSISAFSCVVFLSIAITQLDTIVPWAYALQRTLDILMGVVAAFAINLLLPNNSPPEAYETEDTDHATLPEGEMLQESEASFEALPDEEEDKKS